MELISKPIVRQREELIPPQVKHLRSYVQRYVLIHKIVLYSLVLIACTIVVIYSSPAFVFMYGKVLEDIIGIVSVVIIVCIIYLLLVRLLAPLSIEKYYEQQLVLVEIDSSKETIGRFTQAEIHDVLEKLSIRMGFLIVPGVFVYDKHMSAANAFYTNLVDHHTKAEKIVLHKSLFFILNRDQIRAVVAHELGHLIQPWPFLYRSKRFGRACELLADYNALVYAGLLPAVNSLINIYARNEYFCNLWEKAHEMLLASGFQVDSVDELAEKAAMGIEEQRTRNDSGEEQALRLVQRLQVRSKPDRLSLWQSLIMRLKIRKANRLKIWRKRWKVHIQEQFKQFYSDRYIDENEFKLLVEQLAKDKKSSLFIPSSPRELKSDHPTLHDRLLFLAQCANIIK